MPAALSEIPVNPNTAAIMATIKKMMVQRNIVFNLNDECFVNNYISCLLPTLFLKCAKAIFISP